MICLIRGSTAELLETSGDKPSSQSSQSRVWAMEGGVATDDLDLDLT